MSNMKKDSLLELHRLEQDHWWYQGTRFIYDSLLRYYVSRPCGPVLDVGCGTGGNLNLLSQWGPVIGLEPSRIILDSDIAEAATLVQGKGEALPFRDATFGLVTLLGVIEHVMDDRQLLREVRRVCRENGTVLLLTSAFRFLWSQHDEANQHVRRYRAFELRQKAEGEGFAVLFLSYLNALLFPIALPIRLFQRLKPKARDPHLDMFPMPEPFNTLLANTLKLEGRLMPLMRFPVGVSLITVLKR